jgi:hypothetical protein
LFRRHFVAQPIRRKKLVCPTQLHVAFRFDLVLGMAPQAIGFDMDRRRFLGRRLLRRGFLSGRLLRRPLLLGRNLREQRLLRFEL